MSLVNMNKILQEAKEKKYAVPAFDVSNLEMMRSVVEMCGEERSPAILMCLQPDLEANGLKMISAAAKACAEDAEVPVCLHLDHSTSLENIKRAIDAGFSSVMYDGSMLPFDKNAENTARVVEFAHGCGISVEAELGHVCDAIAGMGENSSLTEENPDDSLTDPDEVMKFIKLTGVDALAVAIGTAHGVYRHKPVLRFDVLEKINAVSKCPLVLHGGSGTPDDDIRRTIELGITKINIFSEVLNAFNTGLKNKLNSIDNLSMWPVYIYADAIAGMQSVIRSKIRIFGSNNRT